MTIVAGFDVHKAQITFDALDLGTGEVHRGRIPSSREAVREWVERFEGQQVDVAVEAGTGWLFVCEELAGAGATAHLAEPAETRALRGPKRRAKTDREDARWLRTLLAEGRLPESWMSPGPEGGPADSGRLALGAREQLLVGLARPLGMRFVDVVAGVRQQLDLGLASDLVAAEAHDDPIAWLFRGAIAFHGIDYAGSARYR